MAKAKLVTKAIFKALPEIYSQDGKNPHEIKVPLKIFDPTGPGTWYLWEYDPEERVFFGACKIHEIELGYVSLDELESVRGRWGLPLERDRWWEGTLQDVIDAEPGLGWMKKE